MSSWPVLLEKSAATAPLGKPNSLVKYLARLQGIFSEVVTIVNPVSQKGLAVGSADTAFVRWADRIATYCLCTVIALVPFPFGSTSPQVIAVWVLLLSLAVGLASFRALTSRDVMFLCGFATVAVGWAFVVFDQMSANPIFGNELINSIWSQTAAITGKGLKDSISVARHQPVFSAGSQIACMLSIIAGYLIGRNRHAAYALLETFAGSGLIYASYGILAFTFWPDYLLWQQKFGYNNLLTATFTNPNVAAVYLGACAIAWLLMLATSLHPVSSGQTRLWQSFSDALLKHPSRRTIICFAASFVVVSALFMTGSRAGSILFLAAISAAAATLYRRALGPRGLLLVFPLCAAGVIFVLLKIFGSLVTQRIESGGLFDVGRWNTYLSTLEIIKEHPWLGTGLGTFRWAFPRYRSGDIFISGIWEQSHSTPLELASEMGIPFTLLVVAAWLVAFVVLRRGMLRRKRDEILPTAAFWTGLLAVIHSQIDFSLQIPGFSVAVCTLVGMGLAQAASSRYLNLTPKDMAS